MNLTHQVFFFFGGASASGTLPTKGEYLGSINRVVAFGCGRISGGATNRTTEHECGRIEKYKRISRITEHDD